MLKVKTYLKEVPGKGIGLFADQDIKKDQLVSKFEFPDIAITVDKFVELDELTQDHFYYYGWLESNVVHLSADNDKFTNHSKDPNLYDSGDSSYALKDIAKDEELTCNYYDLCDWVKLEGLGFEEK